MDNSQRWSGSKRTERSPCNATTTVPLRPCSTRRRGSPGLSLLLLVAVVAGQAATPVRGSLRDFSPPGIIQYGTCAQPKSHESFHFEQFGGLWYQVAMVPNNYMEATKCITMNFRWNGVTAYNVTTHGLNDYNERAQQEANITQIQPKDPAIKPYLQIRSRGVPRVPYHVVRTDYSGYACVYSCFELFGLMFEAFSVLSRSPEIDAGSLDVCYGAFDSLGLDLTRLAPVQQAAWDCLEAVLEGSGGGPEYQDQEEDEDENALATLTSGEVNQRGPSNPTSSSRSKPKKGMEESTMMEEDMEDLVEEVNGVGGGREKASSSSSSSSSSSFSSSSSSSSSSQTRNRTVVAPRIDSNEDSRDESGEEYDEEGEDQQLYIDGLSLDAILNEENRGQGGSENGDTDKGPAATTSARELLQPYGGSGGAMSPTPLLLIALFSLALWSRVHPTP